ncbi:DUF2236 domain-containing protein [Kribbella antibiotica]|uniref:DUF2236 domain-containing protein n=1 Tax=Kribbella antibiotica TaxID=190195 RepID=A0A4R4ZWW1_9ACTN|nr:oxygenase MpaB family protein [Kribbella antibiotica]TDD61662.1 DUF2236 domain-containing protein [Kribbella antibiotica]
MPQPVGIVDPEPGTRRQGRGPRRGRIPVPTESVVRCPRSLSLLKPAVAVPAAQRGRTSHHQSERLVEDSAVIRRVAREGLLIAGGGRATVLQISHPQIAQGTADFSNFAGRPLNRLHATVTYLYGVLFGTREEARKVSDAVVAMHRRVSGRGYSANDPELQVWVAATLYDTAMVLYEPVFGQLSDADADACYQQYSVLATAIGCPEHAWPASRAEFSDYWQEMISTLPIGDTSRELARALLSPADLPLILRPTVPPYRFITIGLLPDAIRQRLGYSWTPRQDRLLHHGLRLTSAIYPHLPLTLREAPKTHFLNSLRRRTPQPE